MALSRKVLKQVGVDFYVPLNRGQTEIDYIVCIDMYANKVKGTNNNGCSFVSSSSPCSCS